MQDGASGQPAFAQPLQDARPQAFQCGAFLDEELVSVVTFTPETAPDHAEGLPAPVLASQWHLRALATAPGHEGKGLARQAVAFGLKAIFAAGAPGSTGVWLYSKESAYGFYQRLGFSSAGAPFLTDSGPYDLFWISGPLESQDISATR